MRLELDFNAGTATVFADDGTVVYHFAATSSVRTDSVELDALRRSGEHPGSLAQASPVEEAPAPKPKPKRRKTGATRKPASRASKPKGRARR